MLRLIGVGGLVLACGLMGIMKARQLKLRLSLLEDFLQMTLALKGQISYFKEPLPEVFKKVDKRADSRACELLAGLGDVMEQKDAQIARFWPQKVAEIYKDMPLSAADREIFNYLGSFIGQTDYENHLMHFAYMEQRLAAQIEEARKELKSKAPMMRKLGFFLGAIPAVLLL